MARLASESVTARIAVVGAETPTGTLLRGALAECRVPGSRVNLYGVADGEAVISEYDGEARLIQDPDLREITAHEVIYLCEPGELTDQVISTARRDSTVIDLIGCLPENVDSRLVHAGVNAAATERRGGYISVPHALSMTLTELLHGVEQVHGVERAAATVLRPASDFGQPGVEELRQQTVRLLSFEEVPAETFGAQLAFNTLHQRDPVAGKVPIEARIREETRCLLGWEQPRLALALLTVPVFYGHGVQLHLHTRQACTLPDLQQILRSSPFFEAPVPAAEATPLRVASESAIVVAEPTEDGLGGFWVWAVAGEVESRSAMLAARLSGLTGATGSSR